jgi:PAS domain S-box-containing protein
MKRLFKLAPHELAPSYESFLASLPIEDARRIDERIKESIREAKRFSETYRYICADGSEIFIHGRGEVFRDAAGKVVRMAGTAMDVTRQKTTELALRKSEARLSQAIEIANMGSWEIDHGNGTLIWSDEIYRAFGFEKGRFTPSAEAFFSCVHPDDVSKVRQEIASRNASGISYGYEHRIVRPDGEVRHVYQRAQPIVDGNGHLLSTLGVIQDITERKQAEQALREAEERFRGIFAQAAVGIGLMTPAGRFLMVNQKLCELMNRSEAELLEIRFHELIGPKDFSETMIRSQKLISGEIDTFSQIIRYSPMPGKLLWGKLTVSTIRQEDSERIALLGIVEDITEGRRAEEQLRQAQKMEAVGQLTGGIAHDFNNLLTVIMSNLALLRDQFPGDGEVDEMIERGFKAAERGAALTDRLLAFSRKQTLMPSALDLNQIVSDMTAILRPALGETVAMQIHGQTDLWPCQADQSQLENALLNLTINARDALDGKSGGSMTIEAANSSLTDVATATQLEIEPGDSVTLSVADNGGGMTKETMGRAFEPFFTTKAVGAGSGLGLSMVYGFAKQSGGGLTIDSEPGEGTKVTLFLPRSQDGLN